MPTIDNAIGRRSAPGASSTRPGRRARPGPAVGLQSHERCRAGHQHHGEDDADHRTPVPGGQRTRAPSATPATSERRAPGPGRPALGYGRWSSDEGHPPRRTRRGEAAIHRTAACGRARAWRSADEGRGAGGIGAHGTNTTARRRARHRCRLHGCWSNPGWRWSLPWVTGERAAEYAVHGPNTSSTSSVPHTCPCPGRPGGWIRWAVETHGLTKRFGTNVAVNGVELLVPRGCAFGYLGPNGAGKTTLIRVLLGLTHADAGTMSLLGYPVPQHRDEALARVGAIVDEPRFHGHLTGRQNLRCLAAAREPAARDRIDAALERVGIRHRADDRVAKYSMGMRQRLGVAACLIGDPQLLILDEPMNGLDPAGMHDMRDMIRVAGRRGSHGRAVVAPARRGGADLRRGGHRGPRQRHPARPDLGAAGRAPRRAAGRLLRTRPGPRTAGGHRARRADQVARSRPDGLAITLPAGTPAT